LELEHPLSVLFNFSVSRYLEVSKHLSLLLDSVFSICQTNCRWLSPNSYSTTS